MEIGVFKREGVRKKESRKGRKYMRKRGKERTMGCETKKLSASVPS